MIAEVVNRMFMCMQLRMCERILKGKEVHWEKERGPILIQRHLQN
jgi:hypothetical protein